MSSVPIVTPLVVIVATVAVRSWYSLHALVAIPFIVTSLSLHVTVVVVIVTASRFMF